VVMVVRARAASLVMLLSAVHEATSFNSNIPVLKMPHQHRPNMLTMQHHPGKGAPLTDPSLTAFRAPIRQAASPRDSSMFYTKLQAAVRENEVVDLETELKGFSGYAVCSNEAELEDKEQEGEVSINAARGMILLAALLCGTNFGAIKLLQDGGLEPSVLMAARFVLAAVCMSPMLAKTDPKIIAKSIEVGVWLSLGYISQAIALQTTPAGTTAFLCSLTTVVCPVIEKFTGVRVTAQAWGAAALAVAGAAFLELSGDELPGIGDLFALMQPICFGYNFYLIEESMKDNPEQALPITTIQVVVCAVMAVVWAAFDAHGVPDLSHLTSHLADPMFDFALVWLGLVSTAFILVLQTFALGKLPSSETAVVFSSEPLWGAGFASLLLGEKIGANTVFGGSLIIGACVGRVIDIDRVRRQAKVIRYKAHKTLKETLTLER